MSLPETLKIGGYTYEVVSKEDDKRYLTAIHAWGLFDQDEQRVYIDKASTFEQKKETLIHEMLHAACMLSNLLPDNVAEQERIVKGLSMGLHTIFTDNPSILTYLSDND